MAKMTTFVLVHGAWRGGGATSRWREEDIEARRRPAPAAHPGEQFCTYVVGQRAYPAGAMHDSQPPCTTQISFSFSLSSWRPGPHLTSVTPLQLAALGRGQGGLRASISRDDIGDMFMRIAPCWLSVLPSSWP
jgi:hypothetical protein